MRIKTVTNFLFLLITATNLFAQNELLNELEDKTTQNEPVTATFKALQICNLQSTKLPGKGDYYVIISHRFGD